MYMYNLNEGDVMQHADHTFCSGGTIRLNRRLPFRVPKKTTIIAPEHSLEYVTWGRAEWIVANKTTDNSDL